MTTYLKCFGRVPVKMRGYDEECLKCSSKIICEPLKIERRSEIEYHNECYSSCPDCGFPLAPSSITIKEGFFKNTITDGKECRKCGYKITYTYKE